VRAAEALLDWLLSVPMLGRLLMFLAEVRSIRDCAAFGYRCPKCGGYVALRYVEGVPHAFCRRCKLLCNFYELAMCG
jgi:hypothetical protein